MTDKPRHPPYWFFHEYVDEARRMRIHKVTADTEQEARRLHRHACEFLWVTDHVEPSVSALYTRDDRDRPIASARRPGQSASTGPVPMPDHIRKQLATVRIGHEAALSGVRATGDWNPVLPPPSPPRTPTKQDRFDTPF